MKHAPWDFLTGEPEKDRRNVSILLESVEELYGPRPLDELMRRAVDRAIRVTGAERGILLLATGGVLDAAVVRDADGHDMPLGERYSQTVVQKVWTSGEASLTMDTADAHTTSLSESIVALRLLSVMGVPMPISGRNTGVLYVDSTARVKEFTQSDFALLKALGGLVALAVENARLLAEKEEQDRLKRELLAAQQIQQRLLPTDLPQPAGFELAGVGRACEETSGDYYDAVPLRDGRLALVMGDVAGHGLGPAMLMVSTRALLHSALRTQTDPVEVMSVLNTFLQGDMPDASFMSMFLGVLDPPTRAFRYVSAGHNPPLLRHPDGSIEELVRTGPVLGILTDAAYGASPPRNLASGQVLMLYTDGIFEAHDVAGEMYGEERLQASFRRHGGGDASARQVVDAVLEDLMAFVGEQPLDDDVTCLVVRVL